MNYMCLVYFDEQEIAGLEGEARQGLDRASGGYDDALTARGQLVVAHALQKAEASVTVRVRDGQVSSTDGPFMETREVLGGFLLIEAADMDEAVRVASGIPLAQRGAVEVRPIMDFRAAGDA